MTLNEYIEKIRIKIKDTSNEISDSDISESLNEALNKLSIDYPGINSKTYIFQGEYIFDLPEDWNEEFTWLQGIKINKEDKTIYLEESDYNIYVEERTFKIKNNDLSISDEVILFYSVPYKLEENIKGNLVLPLIYYASSVAVFTLAQKYAHLYETDQTTDPKVNYRVEELLKISELYKKKYEEIICNLICGGNDLKGYMITNSHNKDITGIDRIFH
ncbi:MAG TPA: hypothetical protein VIR55_10265 [Ignavibacteria bacterium]